MMTLTTWFIMIIPSVAESLVILSPDGLFLGVVGDSGNLCSRYDSDCVWNRYSEYGSQYSGTSIFSDYSQYGSEIGRYSVCNHRISYEETPSLFLVDGDYIAFFDYIGPDSNTLVGRDLYILACRQ